VFVLVADLLKLIATQGLTVETVRAEQRGGIVHGFRKVPEALSASIAFGL
jgi:hypothetical protein